MKKSFPLEQEIYSKESILEAIEDFSEVCNANLLDNYHLEIEWDDEAEIDTLFNEFMNYVISL